MPYTINDLLDLADHPPRPRWHQDAACLGMGPDLFFPTRGGPSAEAKAICRTCPVSTECLETALARCEKFGVWGALSERQRRPFRGAWNRARAEQLRSEADENDERSA